MSPPSPHGRLRRRQHPTAAGRALMELHGPFPCIRIATEVPGTSREPAARRLRADRAAPIFNYCRRCARRRAPAYLDAGCMTTFSPVSCPRTSRPQACGYRAHAASLTLATPNRHVKGASGAENTKRSPFSQARTPTGGTAPAHLHRITYRQLRR